MRRKLLISLSIVSLLMTASCIPASPGSHNTEGSILPAKPPAVTQQEAVGVFKSLVLDACTIHNLFLNSREPIDMLNSLDFEQTAYDVSPPRIIETEWNPYYRYTEEDFDWEYRGIRFGDYEWMQNKLKSTYTDDMISKYFSYDIETACGFIYLNGFIYANTSVGGDGVYELSLNDASFIYLDEATIEMSFPKVYWQDEEVGYIYLDEETHPPVTIRLVYEENLWKIDEWSNIALSFWFSEEEENELMDLRQTK